MGWLNQSELFLLIISIMSIMSPIISLISPIFMLLIPFIIMQLKNIKMSLKEYSFLLTVVLSQYSIGKIFNLHNASLTERIYICASVGFYFYGIYQNILGVIHFIKNMKEIHHILINLQKYLNHSIIRDT